MSFASELVRAAKWTPASLVWDAGLEVNEICCK